MSDFVPGPGRWHRPDDEEENGERAEEEARLGTPKNERMPGNAPLDDEMAGQLAAMLDHLSAYLLFTAIEDVVSRDVGGAAEGDANRIFAAAHAIRTAPHTLDSAETRIVELRLFSKVSREPGRRSASASRPRGCRRANGGDQSAVTPAAAIAAVARRHSVAQGVPQ